MDSATQALIWAVRGWVGIWNSLPQANWIHWSLVYWLFLHNFDCFSQKFCAEKSLSFILIYIVLFVSGFRNWHFPTAELLASRISMHSWWQFHYCFRSFAPWWMKHSSGVEESFTLPVFCIVTLGKLSILEAALPFPQEKYKDFPPLQSALRPIVGHHSMKITYFI